MANRAPATARRTAPVARRHSVKRMRGTVETGHFIILDDKHPDDPDLAQCIFLNNDDQGQWTFATMSVMRIPRISMRDESDRDRIVFRGKLVRAQPGMCTADTQVEYDGQVFSAEFLCTMPWHDVTRICADADIDRSSFS